LLRWFEGPESNPREEYVEVIDEQMCQTVIRSSCELSRETEVTLIGKDYTAQGVVQACRVENDRFLLTLVARPLHRDSGSYLDPGSLAVDDFLTEEQEAAILAEIAEERLVEQALSGLDAESGLDTPSPWQTLQPHSGHRHLLRH
jgi:hypothetical protein